MKAKSSGDEERRSLCHHRHDSFGRHNQGVLGPQLRFKECKYLQFAHPRGGTMTGDGDRLGLTVLPTALPPGRVYIDLGLPTLD